MGRAAWQRGWIGCVGPICLTLCLAVRCPAQSSERTTASEAATEPGGLFDHSTLASADRFGPGTADSSPQFMGGDEVPPEYLPSPPGRYFDLWSSSGRGPRPRHQGKGLPLQGTSWRNRPWHMDWFVGMLFPGNVASGIGQDNSIIGGYRLGHDYEHYWGWETRLGLAYPPLNDPVNTRVRSNRMAWWDGQLLFYPWGDARYRPYLAWGLGVTTVHFEQQLGRPTINRGLITMPIGMGLKYQWRRWLAVRLDLYDHIAFGSGAVRAMNNWSMTAGIEWRFGSDRRRDYLWR